MAIVSCLNTIPESINQPPVGASKSEKTVDQAIPLPLTCETEDAYFEAYFETHGDVSGSTIYLHDGRINLCNDTHLLRFKNVEFAGAFYMPRECREHYDVKCQITYVGEEGSAELSDSEWTFYNDSYNVDLRRGAKFRDLSLGTIYCLAGNAHRYLPQQANVVLLEDFDWSECNPQLMGPHPLSYSHFRCSESSQMRDVAVITTANQKFVMWSTYNAMMTKSFVEDIKAQRAEISDILDLSLSTMPLIDTKLATELMDDLYFHELSVLTRVTSLGLLDRGSQFGIAMFAERARRIKSAYSALNFEISKRSSELERELLAYGFVF